MKLTDNIPDKIHKGHMTVKLNDPFPELYAGHHYTPAVDLVAWLAKCVKYRSVVNASRIVGISQMAGYRRLHELERRIKNPVWVRFSQPFTLTNAGRYWVNRYHEQD